MATRLPPAVTGGGGCFNGPFSSAVASAAKLQLVQSPTYRSAPLMEGAFMQPARGGFRAASITFNSGFGKKSGLEKQRAKSMSSLSMEVAEVRMLADDAPVKEGVSQSKGSHAALMSRLKSRTARQEAEATRSFLAAYRADANISPASEAKLDALLKTTTERAEDMRQRSEELRLEVMEAERKLEKVNALSAGRATDTELQQLNAFERSQRRIQEDKREEDLQRQRDEVQANYAKVHRRLQNELIELRDFKVLLREFRRVRLEKLHDTLGKVTDGRRLRACVREMIRHGAQRILQKLEAAQLPLEPWMNEVLINCCHVEIRIQEAEDKLLHIRREALKPIKDSVHALMQLTKQERTENLWKSLAGRQGGVAHVAEDASGLRRQTTGASCADYEGGGDGAAPERSVSCEVLQEMRAAEAHVTALRRLLNDMRQNAAAVICNRIRQVEKGGGREASREAMAWGNHMLSMLVSEEFAKTTMKELQKSAPAAKLTQ
mmetsp:Transcript_70149/g.196589  ORF Transcript_70149/g.196589 Transcript_70149/m.196589 type:complete len:492 (-) Transcript_70149:57-1532(-)